VAHETINLLRPGKKGRGSFDVCVSSCNRRHLKRFFGEMETRTAARIVVEQHKGKMTGFKMNSTIFDSLENSFSSGVGDDV